MFSFFRIQRLFPVVFCVFLADFTEVHFMAAPFELFRVQEATYQNKRIINKQGDELTI